MHYGKAVMAKVSGGTADRLVVKRVEQGATKNGAFRVTVTYSDYGTPVTAPAPDPADTVEPSEPAALDKGAPRADPGPGGMVAGTARPPRRRPRRKGDRGERGQRWRDGGG
ncbi:hypothetical protein ACFXDE_20000 [Kitasatospora sp. NPDC059408]|uniref:hypothetical protein n=1 Tax=Kitasatospora sp. NPDC059408 TaxID=3346823 RepID=UPI00367F3A42